MYILYIKPNVYLYIGLIDLEATEPIGTYQIIDTYLLTLRVCSQLRFSNLIIISFKK